MEIIAEYLAEVGNRRKKLWPMISNRSKKDVEGKIYQLCCIRPMKSSPKSRKTGKYQQKRWTRILNCLHQKKNLKIMVALATATTKRKNPMRRRSFRRKKWWWLNEKAPASRK